MFKRIVCGFGLASLFVVNVFAAQVTKNDCDSKGENFIFAGNECIEYHKADGDTEGSLIIVVHGSWAEGTNTLGRYAPFADNLAMATDITTIAVALPAYSGSSSNNLKALIHGDKRPLSATKEYVEFLGHLVEGLKLKYNAQEVTYVGHSAGAMMGATLLGKKPNLIQNIALAGGRYDIHAVNSDKTLISVVDVIDNVSKDVEIALIYGTKDTISEPKVTTDFYELAKKKGLNAFLVEAKGAEHLDLDMTDESVKAISQIVSK